jgi:hypothetical protein
MGGIACFIKEEFQDNIIMKKVDKKKQYIWLELQERNTPCFLAT